MNEWNKFCCSHIFFFNWFTLIFFSVWMSMNQPKIEWQTDLFSVFGVHLLDNNTDKWSNKHKFGSEDERKKIIFDINKSKPYANVNSLKAARDLNLNEIPIIYPAFFWFFFFSYQSPVRHIAFNTLPHTL